MVLPRSLLQSDEEMQFAFPASHRDINTMQRARLAARLRTRKCARGLTHRAVPLCNSTFSSLSACLALALPFLALPCLPSQWALIASLPSHTHLHHISFLFRRERTRFFPTLLATSASAWLRAETHYFFPPLLLAMLIIRLN